MCYSGNGFPPVGFSLDFLRIGFSRDFSSVLISTIPFYILKYLTISFLIDGGDFTRWKCHMREYISVLPLFVSNIIRIRNLIKTEHRKYGINGENPGLILGDNRSWVLKLQRQNTKNTTKQKA